MGAIAVRAAPEGNGGGAECLAGLGSPGRVPAGLLFNLDPQSRNRVC